MSEAQSPDAMKKLVKFMICLAISGTIIAIAVYFIVIFPAQQAAGLSVPWNGICISCY